MFSGSVIRTGLLISVPHNAVQSKAMSDSCFPYVNTKRHHYLSFSLSWRRESRSQQMSAISTSKPKHPTSFLQKPTVCLFCHLTFPDYHKQHLWMESQTNSSEGCDAPAQTGHWLIPRRQSLVTSTSLVSPPLCFSFRTTREMSDNALGCRALTYEMAVTP